ncbi:MULTISPECIES: J domain-containing protein [Pseudanabaena]|uniref:J domain-containing protein n=1 Tax=Pseudanabaena TaxID=1152 RepID=UPI002478F4BA|nr:MULTISPECIES: DnaJ domain-containing protein [Pseudanabaena]MEA5489690.1 DnaJ domain-containing protein [Pseudanabaena sp. CCNP1317]WGS73849.1 DnaJ domain-containing protein [Pseudanabaena galeata CCNP1313]
MGKPENFKINKGLASYGISDHYAILGLPMTTDAAQIRKKFLKLAKILHPDVFGRTPEEKETATKYFSKMVSPAYQLLNHDRERGEYLATLRMFAQNKKQKEEVPTLSSEIAQKLYRIPHEITYKQYVEQISPKQYETLDSIMEYTATLSELNLVYLFTQTSLGFTSGSSSAAASPVVSQSANAEATPAAKPAQSPALRNLNMAELFISKKQWTDALKELLSAEKIDPNNAKVYALKGLVQMNQNAAAIAKSSFQKALKLDPKEPTALKYINQVTAATKPPEKPPEKKGGLFGWGKK